MIVLALIAHERLGALYYPPSFCRPLRSVSYAVFTFDVKKATARTYETNNVLATTLGPSGWEGLGTGNEIECPQ